MKILVLGGGISPEREVSLRSAAAIRDQLTDLGYAVTYLDPQTASHDIILATASKSDLVFPILHGLGGEDGSLQALLDEHQIAYLGSGPEACKTTFDKRLCKLFLEANDIPTPRWEVVSPKTFGSSKLAKRPFVLKPITGGSSIDTFIIRDAAHIPDDLMQTLENYGEMLLEELIQGQETTVAILSNSALPVVEIVPPSDQTFDYDNKYNGATSELCPPQHISLDLQKKLQALALEVHTKCHCRHLSRTDIMLDRTGRPYVIDVNTLPGMTGQSLFPKAASEAGMSFKELVETFVTLASV